MESFLNPSQPLSLTDKARNELKQSAGWTMFLAIAGFVGIALILIVAALLVIGTTFRGFEYWDQNPQMFPIGMVAIFYILSGVAYFFPCYFLLNYSLKMKAALIENTELTLEEAFVNLKRCFKFMGIFLIILLSIYFLAFLGIFVFGGLMT